MQHTNAPRIFARASGNLSVETEIIDSQRHQRQIPIVDVCLTILQGTVKSPNILFKFALEEAYASITHFMGLPAKPESDTVRMVIKHNELQSHNHMWSSSTFVVGHSHALNEILQNWETRCNLVKKWIYLLVLLNLLFNVHLLVNMNLLRIVLVLVLVILIRLIWQERIECIIVFV
jgi:hypothetical protein